jgi:putative DNA primase/helicase
MGEVRRIIGGVEKVEVKEEISDAERKRLLNETWEGSKAITENDPAWLYLNERTGLREMPKTLRYHPALYNAETRSNMPALIAKVTDLSNRPVAIHRIYLTARGEKAPVAKNKMLLGSMPEGSAIRLMPYETQIGVAEGIETAISAYAIFGIPTWAAVTAGGLEKWKPPEICTTVWVFGDNDKTYTGQLAAYRLAWKLAQLEQFEVVKVAIPEILGADWNDVLKLFGTQDAKKRYT